MAYWRVTLRIAAKDLLSEARTRDAFNAMLFFALLVIVLFSFSFQPTTDAERRMAGGLLWVAFLFAGLIVLDRSFLRERINECLDALRLSPAPPSAIFLGKCVANFLFVLGAEGVVLPLFLIFFDLSIRGAAEGAVLVLLLGTWALVVNGTFFAAMTAHLRSREVMLPLVLVPISVPALIAVVEASASLLLGGDPIGAWLQMLAGFDLIYTTLSLVLFKTILEGA